MSDEYVVLRSRRAAAAGPIRGPGRARTRAGPETPSRVTGLVVDVVDTPTAAEIENQPDIEAAAPSMPLQLMEPVTSAAPAAAPAATTTWGIRAVGADTSPFDGAGVVVAVLDTGIDATHPAFQGVKLIHKNFTDDVDEDRNGHGTHCAGTIFGRDVDGMRIGVARGVTRALIGKVIGRNGATTKSIVSAINWAIGEGANVISMSLGIDFPGYQARLQKQGLQPQPATSRALEGYRLNIRLFDKMADMISELSEVHQPCLLISASGNESLRDGAPPYEIAASPPAVSSGVIAVGALQEGPQGLGVAPFSNTGPAVSAPGVGIVSAKLGGGLVALDGTSMAAPHVAGVAALWAQKLKASGSLRLDAFTAKLLASAEMGPLAPASKAKAVGDGIIRAPQR